jgi:hypothetical protein
MKLKSILLITALFISGINVEAQLLEKLKERAKEKGLETREVSLDTTDNAKNRTTSFEEEELVIKSAKDFFTRDVVMALYNAQGQLVQTSYFDDETIAMRTEQVDGPNPIYHDDKGKFYAYDIDEGQYKTIKLLPSSSMGFMMAGMTTQAYKLPSEPYFEAFQALEKINSGLNFIVLEMAFIYKPIHFEDDENYTPQKVVCNGSNNCIRFNYTDPEYTGSYIQFDTQGKLREFNLITTNTQFSEDGKNSSGKFVFSYKPCTVKLPDAIEQSMIPGPLGKMLNLERGLEPWKHNKKDKKKNKN